MDKVKLLRKWHEIMDLLKESRKGAIPKGELIILLFELKEIIISNTKFGDIIEEHDLGFSPAQRQQEKEIKKTVREKLNVKNYSLLGINYKNTLRRLEKAKNELVAGGDEAKLGAKIRKFEESLVIQRKTIDDSGRFFWEGETPFYIKK